MLVRVHVLDVFLISNDFVVSAMKTIFQFDKCQGDMVFGARRCAHDRRNFCDKEPPGIDCRSVFAIPGKNQQVPKKVPIRLQMESARCGRECPVRCGTCGSGTGYDGYCNMC